MTNRWGTVEIGTDFLGEDSKIPQIVTIAMK